MVREICALFADHLGVVVFQTLEKYHNLKDLILHEVGEFVNDCESVLGELASAEHVTEMATS